MYATTMIAMIFAGIAIIIIGYVFHLSTRKKNAKVLIALSSEYEKGVDLGILTTDELAQRIASISLSSATINGRSPEGDILLKGQKYSHSLFCKEGRTFISLPTYKVQYGRNWRFIYFSIVIERKINCSFEANRIMDEIISKLSPLTPVNVNRYNSTEYVITPPKIPFFAMIAGFAILIIALLCGVFLPLKPPSYMKYVEEQAALATNLELTNLYGMGEDELLKEFGFEKNDEGVYPDSSTGMIILGEDGKVLELGITKRSYKSYPDASIFGVTIGMDKEEAAKKLEEAGFPNATTSEPMSTTYNGEPSITDFDSYDTLYDQEKRSAVMIYYKDNCVTRLLYGPIDQEALNALSTSEVDESNALDTSTAENSESIQEKETEELKPGTYGHFDENMISFITIDETLKKGYVYSFSQADNGMITSNISDHPTPIALFKTDDGYKFTLQGEPSYIRNISSNEFDITDSALFAGVLNGHYEFYSEDTEVPSEIYTEDESSYSSDDVDMSEVVIEGSYHSDDEVGADLTITDMGDGDFLVNLNIVRLTSFENSYAYVDNGVMVIDLVNDYNRIKATFEPTNGVFLLTVTESDDMYLPVGQQFVFTKTS